MPAGQPDSAAGIGSRAGADQSASGSLWLRRRQAKADGAAAGKTVTLKVVTSGSSQRWLSESGQGIKGFYINGQSIGTGSLHGDSTYEWSITV